MSDATRWLCKTMKERLIVDAFHFGAMQANDNRDKSRRNLFKAVSLNQKERTERKPLRECGLAALSESPFRWGDWSIGILRDVLITNQLARNLIS
jgi:hypothetical protein